MTDGRAALEIHPIKTRIFRQGESLESFVASSVPKALIRERMILAVTAKIVSLAENRVVAKDSIAKRDLIEQEADFVLGAIAHGSIATLKESLLIASSGIDESNSENQNYLLFPESPFDSARRLHEALKKKWQLKDLGILLTDSRTTPFRFGVTGVSIAHFGFEALQNKVGVKDLFDRPLKMTKVNVADGLAAAATLMMGEADESRPLAVILIPDAALDVKFNDETSSSELRPDVAEDLFYPLFESRLKGSQSRSKVSKKPE